MIQVYLDPFSLAYLYRPETPRVHLYLPLYPTELLNVTICTILAVSMYDRPPVLYRDPVRNMIDTDALTSEQIVEMFLGSLFCSEGIPLAIFPARNSVPPLQQVY